MQLVHVYLNFPGTTEEALRYYEKVFGTKMMMVQTFGDTPFIKNPPEAAKKKIMHAQLPITETVHRREGQGRGGPRLRAPQRRWQGAHAARERALGSLLRHVHGSLRRTVDGQPAEPGVRQALRINSGCLRYVAGPVVTGR